MSERVSGESKSRVVESEPNHGVGDSERGRWLQSQYYKKC